MHPREKVLEQARLYHLKGEPLPVDLLAHADALGILISSLAPPPKTKLKEIAVSLSRFEIFANQ